MPVIEILSLRLNLDKEDDRRLFEILQKRADPGKRNEFMKQALLECLSEEGSGSRSNARQSRKQLKDRAEPTANRIHPEVSRSVRTATAGPQPLPKPVSDAPSVGPAVEMESDSDAAGLVESFIQ